MPLKPLKKIEEEENDEEEDEEEKEIPEKTKEKPKEIFLVARDLPTQQIRQVKLEDGSIGTVVTVEEALTEILNIIKKLEKGLL